MHHQRLKCQNFRTPPRAFILYLYPKISALPTAHVPKNPVHYQSIKYPKIQCTTHLSITSKFQCTIHRSNTQKYSAIPTVHILYTVQCIPKQSVHFPPLIYPKSQCTTHRSYIPNSQLISIFHSLVARTASEISAEVRFLWHIYHN